MISFVARNEEGRIQSPSKDLNRVSKEAQELKDFKTYENALRLQQTNQLEAAEKSYLELLGSPLLETEDLSGPSSKLKYLALKNLGTIYETQQQKQNALQRMLEAAEIDDSDPVLWYHIGIAARQVDILSISRKSFEKALSIQPQHWLSLDQLLEVLYLIGDYTTCLEVVNSIEEAMGGSYKKATVIKKQILLESRESTITTDSLRNEGETSENVELVSDLIQQRVKRQRTETPEVKISPLTHYLKTPTWRSLGLLLLDILSKQLSPQNSGLLDIPVIITIDENMGEVPITPASSTSTTKETPRSRKEPKNVVRQSARMKDRESRYGNEEEEGALDDLFLKFLPNFQVKSISPDIPKEDELPTEEIQKKEETKDMDENRHVTEFLSQLPSSSNIFDHVSAYLTHVCAHTQCLQWNKPTIDMILSLQEKLLPYKKNPQSYWLTIAEIYFSKVGKRVRGESLDRSRFYMEELFLSILDFKDNMIFLIRLYWLKASHELVTEDPPNESLQSMEICRSMFESLGITRVATTTGEITLDTLDTKLNKVTKDKREKLVWDNFEASNYEEVIRILGNVVLEDRIAAGTLPLVDALIRSYMAINNLPKALLSASKLLENPNATMDLVKSTIGWTKECVDSYQWGEEAYEIMISLRPALAFALKRIMLKDPEPDIAIQAWTVFYDCMRLDPRLDEYYRVELFFEIHTILGEQGFCTHNDGVLLKKFITDTFLDEDPETVELHEAELSQCLCCLYDIKDTTRDYANHSTEKKEIDINDISISIPLFKFARQNFKDLNKPSAKTVVEAFYKNLPDLPEYLAHMKPQIEDYLEGRQHTLTFLPLPDTQEPLDFVFRDIYYFKATVTSDANSVITLAKYDLYCSGTRYDSWFLLGNQYQSLMHDALNSVNIPESLQNCKMSIRAYEQACKLKQDSVELWNEYGTTLLVRAFMIKRYQAENVPLEQLLNASLHCFTTAKTLKPTDWTLSYMKGKVMEKLKRNPDEYLEEYYQASIINLRKDEPEPLYRLHASRHKLLQSGFTDLDLLLKYSFKQTEVTPETDKQQFILQDILDAYEECSKRLKGFHKSIHKESIFYLQRNDPQKAKDKIKLLFGERTSRLYWKLPDKEKDRGGKYNLYRKKYGNTFIDILERVQDYSNMESLYHWVKKGEKEIGSELRRKTLAALVRVLTYLFQSTNADQPIVEGDPMLKRSLDLFIEARSFIVKNPADVQLQQVFAGASQLLSDMYRKYSGNPNASLKEAEETIKAKLAATPKKRGPRKQQQQQQQQQQPTTPQQPSTPQQQQPPTPTTDTTPIPIDLE